MSIQQDQTIAFKILSALTNSSLAEEFQEYRNVIKVYLQLSDDEMNRLYDFKKIVNLLNPVQEEKRKFFGIPVKDAELASHQQLVLLEATGAIVTGPTVGNGVVSLGQTFEEIERGREKVVDKKAVEEKEKESVEQKTAPELKDFDIDATQPLTIEYRKQKEDNSKENEDEEKEYSSEDMIKMTKSIRKGLQKRNMLDYNIDTMILPNYIAVTGKNTDKDADKFKEMHFELYKSYHIIRKDKLHKGLKLTPKST